MSDISADSDSDPFEILSAGLSSDIKSLTPVIGLNRQQYFGKAPQMLSVTESRIDTDLWHLYSDGWTPTALAR